MMPARVREVLEDEGLEKGVINGAIGQSEEKYKQLLKETNAPDFTRYTVWGEGGAGERSHATFYK